VVQTPLQELFSMRTSPDPCTPLPSVCNCYYRFSIHEYVTYTKYTHLQCTHYRLQYVQSNQYSSRRRHPLCLAPQDNSCNHCSVATESSGSMDLRFGKMPKKGPTFFIPLLQTPLKSTCGSTTRRW
jgi:hypothetical protein